jgi:protein deglycase
MDVACGQWWAAAAGSEPVETFVPIDILHRADAEITVASTGDFLLVEAMYDVKIITNTLVANCADMSYDLVVLPIRLQRKA